MNKILVSKSKDKILISQNGKKLIIDSNDDRFEELILLSKEEIVQWYSERW